MFLIVTLLLYIVTITESWWQTIDNFPVLGELGCHNCERVYAPVCASDNKTYTNECRMNCRNLYRKDKDKVSIIRYGRCILGHRRSNNIMGLDIIARYLRGN